MFDRTTKMLLATIALALWGLLLRPAFTPIPTRADTAPPVANPNPVLTATDKGVYLYHADGNIYAFDPDDLMLKGRAFYVPAGNPANLKIPRSSIPSPTFAKP